MAIKTAEDAELFAAGRRARSKSQCTSLVIGTHTDTEERNYHQCSGGLDHKGENHGCGCGAQWYARVMHFGPLYDVVFP